MCVHLFHRNPQAHQRHGCAKENNGIPEIHRIIMAAWQSTDQP
jgi:hypothetical protein